MITRSSPRSLKSASAKSLSASREVHLIKAGGKLPANLAPYAEAQNFTGKAEQLLNVPEGVLLGVGDGEMPLILGSAAARLPAGNYRLVTKLKGKKLELALLGWAMGAYRFDHYKTQSPAPTLLVEKTPEMERALKIAEAVSLTRDLINIPANDMGPDALEAVIRETAKPFKATIKVTKGAALLAQNFAMIHAVGRAADQAPRLLDLQWGVKSHPKITLVGKGVCFDSGGLDIKSAGGMILMKKDMGGAANALGLAHMIMAAKLKIRLRVLIPVVENAIGAGAFRPGDVLRSRKGLSVEIGNTDAEGRLVLADALALAAEEQPEHIISLATLTGAARVALGPVVMPFYTTDESMAKGLAKAADNVADPLWRMPFWDGYERELNSPIADMNNITNNSFAGSLTAALFLRRFVEPTTPYTHFDIFGWNPNTRPAHPRGGEAMAVRALFEHLSSRYS